MSADLIKFSFIAGELSPAFYGRPDLEKFDQGLALGRNWFVDYRGGISTRPGTLFCEFIKHDDKNVRIFEFRFAPTTPNTYVLMFGHLYVRFVQNGAYVLEASKTITAVTQAAIGVMSITGHGYASGDWVKLGTIAGMPQISGRTVEVRNPTANTFEMYDTRGVAINTSTYGAFTSGTAARIYTVTTPYTSDDLPGLSVHQYRDFVRMTHLSYAPRTLERFDHTNWTIVTVDFSYNLNAPTNVQLFPLAAGTAGVGFAVTTVDSRGAESLPTNMVINKLTSNYTTTAGGMQVTWNAVSGAAFYNVYRTNVVNAAAYLTMAAQLAYVGKAFGPQFTDNNIIGDFTKTPPRRYNPFANKTIESVTITAPGAGYNHATTTVTASGFGGTGTGFRGFPVVNSTTGEILAVVVIDGGQDYATPVTFTFSGGGAGATASASVSAASGNYPSKSIIFQQRRVYAASENAPLTIWGSKPRINNNFDVSDIVLDSDSYEFELDAEEVSPIKHLVSMKSGLLCLTNSGVWELNGGSADKAITPTNVLADPHTYIGCADLEPIKLDTDLLYQENKGYTIRQLTYNDFSARYSGDDISILSNHLFGATKRLTNWSFASVPYKIAWGARSDGALLSLTIVKEHKVFAWMQHWTQGYFERVLSVQESNTDVVYHVVKRLVNGRWVKYLEKFASREFTSVEDAHFVDSGLSITPNYPAAELTLSGSTGTISATTNVATFAAGDVGKVIRAAGGKGTITVFTNNQQVTVALTRDVSEFIPETTTPKVSASGEWTMDATFNLLRGLHHLENKAVKVLVDGSVYSGTVVNGEINLDSIVSGLTGTRCIIGLGYTAVAKTLPLTAQGAVIENKRKRVPAIVVRQYESRGLKVGTTRNKVYGFRERSNEAYGEPTALQEGAKIAYMQSIWDGDGSLWFVQDEPMPATVLGYVTEVEVGDDPE